jgi:hypothetical protein
MGVADTDLDHARFTVSNSEQFPTLTFRSHPMSMSRSARILTAALAFGSVAIVLPVANAQGPLRRAGQALENAGRNIRQSVEGGIARGEVIENERAVVARVNARLRWDKQLVNSTLDLQVLADGKTILRGLVIDESARKRAVDLASSTVGVTSVVNELKIGKPATVIESVPAVAVPPARVISTPPPAVIVPEAKPAIVEP